MRWIKLMKYFSNIGENFTQEETLLSFALEVETLIRGFLLVNFEKETTKIC
jgi:hypothetical protein